MLRIAIICFNVEGRGTFLRALKLSVELKKFGHSPTIIATNRSGWTVNERYINGVHIVTVPDLLAGSLRSGWDLVDASIRIKWLHNRKFDLVHAFESRPTAIFPALYLQKQGSVLFTDWCDWFGKGGAVEERPNIVIRNTLRPVETFFEENFRHLAQGTTVICSTLFKKALKLGIPSERILLLPNGLDNSDLTPVPCDAARQTLGLNISDFIIGYVGASFPQDIQLMAKTFNIISERIPHARLIHIGRSNYKIPLNNNVITTGELNSRELNLYLSASNICWLPLRNSCANRGRFPLKLSNYLAAGKPVVATAVGDLVEFFNKNQVGLLSIDEPFEIVENVVRLYNDPQLVFELGRNAIEVANDPQNSWSHAAQELEKAYINALI